MIPLIRVVSAQTSQALPTTPWEMIVEAEPVTQVVLAVLAVLSIVSWSVMLAKWREFRRMRRASDEFLQSFERAHTVEDVSASSRRSRANPFTRIFDRAQLFLN